MKFLYPLLFWIGAAVAGAALGTGLVGAAIYAGLWLGHNVRF